MASTVITNAGMELLSRGSASGEPTYWVGYYGVAFVPSEERGDNGTDKLSADMTALTKTGDHIYNLWQGSMVASGYAQGTSAAELGGMAMYTSNLMSRFRYVLDEKGNNNLVMFRGTSDSSVSDVSGAVVYHGVDEEAPAKSGTLPLPAPLFYTTSDKSYSNPPTASEFVNDLNDSDSYDDYPMVDGLPAVTTDTRAYMGPTPDNIPIDGEFEAPLSGVNDRLWVSASKTYQQEGLNGDSSKPVEPGFNQLCKQYWKFKSISNYNRYHAPASAEGFLVDYEPACRNMAKVTKYFPINHYKVVNAKEGASTLTKGRKIASTLRFTIELSLDDIHNTTALRAITQNDEPRSGVRSIDGKTDLFQTKESSIKFNRIGLYAVPMTVHRFYDTVNDDNSRKACRDFRVQFEVDGNAEPKLFAVIDLDTTVYLREGSGETSTYKVNVDINLGEKDAGRIIRDAAVFYNMYEDSSITWYENQLIATASQVEAVTNLALDMGVMKQRMEQMSATNNCDAERDLGDEYAPKNHTHNFMKNLVDGTANPGAVRGVNSALETAPVNFSVFDTFPEDRDAIHTVTETKNNPTTGNGERTFFVVTGTSRSN